jgi:hypothetical protein
VPFTGAEKKKVGVLLETLCTGLCASGTWKSEVGTLTQAVRVFMPSDPLQDDGAVLLSVSSDYAWTMMTELGIISS